MITLENLSKTYRARGGICTVLRNVNAVLPAGQVIGLIGRNGAGKSTLLSLIAGTIHPSAGRVRSHGLLSWPIGMAGALHPDLTGLQNVRFIARVYGVDTDEMTDFVAGFSELGPALRQPVRSLSAGQRARLTFGMAMAIRFDCYLLDEITSVGDARFKAKSAEMLADRMKGAGAIMVSHTSAQIRQTCSAALVLEGGGLRYFADVNEAIAQHERNLAHPATAG